MRKAGAFFYLVGGAVSVDQIYLHGMGSESGDTFSVGCIWRCIANLGNARSKKSGKMSLDFTNVVVRSTSLQTPAKHF